MILPLSLPRLVMRRFQAHWKLATIVFVGIACTTSLAAGGLLFLDSLRQLSFKIAVSRQTTDTVDFRVFGRDMDLTAESVLYHERSIVSAIERNIVEGYRGHDLYLRGDTFVVGHPIRPLPEQRISNSPVSRGYLQYLSGLAERAEVVQGRWGSDAIRDGPGGPIAEGTISRPTADEFNIRTGDTLTFTPSVGVATVITVEVVGVFEPANESDEFWNSFRVFYAPSPLSDSPPPGTRVDPTEPPVAVFLSLPVMVNVVSRAYPGILVQVDPIWVVRVSADTLSGWRLPDIRQRLDDFEKDVTRAMPEATVVTGLITGLVDQVERRSFYASVSLLLLLTLMIATVLFMLAVTVSFLNRVRETGVALLQSRGVSARQMAGVQAAEGLAMAAVSIVVAPVLAVVVVALAGKLPFLSQATDGGLLPVRIGPLPFFIGLAAGTLCLAVIVLPTLLNLTAGLLRHRWAAARPAAISVLHRHNVDVGLLVIGLVMFGEFRLRGQAVSGGLFGDLEINHVLLLTPVLFLLVISLGFMRLFPLVVRFVVGESPALVHVVAWGSAIGVATLAVVPSGPQTVRVTIPVLAGAAILTYLVANRGRRGWSRAVTWAMFVALVAAMLVIVRPEIGSPMFVEAIGLAAVAPLWLLYLGCKRWVRTAPVWLVLPLWRIARNPMEHSYWVILMVLVVGLAVLATTVGGSMERSEIERILHRSGADLRLIGQPTSGEERLEHLQARYEALPGIQSTALAYRQTGSVGAWTGTVLAVEAAKFADVSWSRDDYFDGSMMDIMASLAAPAPRDMPRLPDDAAAVGLWVRPAEVYPTLSAWIVVLDGDDVLRHVYLGDLPQTRWQRLEASLPDDAPRPLHLVAVELYDSLAGVFRGGSPIGFGRVQVDDLYASAPGGRVTVVEDFEGSLAWSPIVTAPVWPESLALETDVERGGRVAGFGFGRTTNSSMRGFYSTRFLPDGAGGAIISDSLVRAGYQQDDRIVARVGERFVTLTVKGSARLFPTVNSRELGFIVVDIDSLLRYSNLVGQNSSEGPTELFIDTVGPGAPGVQTISDDAGRLGLLLEDAQSRLATVREDPLVTAGWRIMLILALAVVVASLVFGYVAYVLMYDEERRFSMGILKSQGMSTLQQATMIGLEHVAVLVVGIALGTWAGLEMSRQTVGSLAVTEAGEAVMPPFMITTDWTLMAGVYAVAVAVFAATLTYLLVNVARVSLGRVLRMEA
jgi:hypothetical protein